MRKVSVHYDNLSVVAAGAGLLAERSRLQKLTPIMSANQNPAGHSTINSGRRKFATLIRISGFSSYWSAFVVLNSSPSTPILSKLQVHDSGSPQYLATLPTIGLNWLNTQP